MTSASLTPKTRRDAIIAASRKPSNMSDDKLDISSSEFMNAVQLAVTKIDPSEDVTGKVLVVSDGTDGPHIIALNSDLVISEYRNDDSSSCDLNEKGVLCELQEEDYSEPNPKRRRVEKDDFSLNLKAVVMDIHNALFHRLRKIEKKLENVNKRCHQVEEKIEQMSSQLQDAGIGSCTFVRNKSGAVIVGLPQNLDNGSSAQLPIPHHIGPNVTLITLNSEEDYPNGSWLGDQNNPETRVRCHISQSDLININRTCHTPEKMALTLLDYLFDRETQACSNISGLGKHGKKQLDPLMIYGIRCHLIHKFGISDRDWHRIKQNMDSKCRTAFRRKQKGMPLTVKAFRDRWVAQDPSIRLPSATYIQMVTDSNQNGAFNPEFVDGEMPTDHELDLATASTINIPISMASGQPTVSITMDDIGEPQIIHTPQGDIQVVHATPEQIAQFQQSGQIQILAGDVIQAADEIQESASP